MDSTTQPTPREANRFIANIRNRETYDTYCGRPGPWGNPFLMGPRVSREQAVELHQEWVNRQISDGSITPEQLTGLTRSPDGKPLKLGCYCVPLLCHCHTLVRYSLAASQSPEQLSLAMKQSTTQWFSKRQEPPQPTTDGKLIRETGLPDRIGPTRVETTAVRSILTPQKGRVTFLSDYDFTINPYIGCSAACDYCYAAGYTGDEKLTGQWGQWVKAKANGAQAIAREAGLMKGARIYMASVTDPYQPLERQACITAAILDAMAEYPPKLVVQTRFPLVTRDIPRFQAITDNGGQVQVNITVTTDDDAIRRLLEPKCPGIPARLKALRQLNEAGITACATVTPMLPVKDPESFARTLQETGIRKVIIQPFHKSEGSGEQYRRSTRPAALQWLEENWGPQWRQKYQRNYAETAAALREAFPGQTGEGQKGFAPPF